LSLKANILIPRQALENIQPCCHFLSILTFAVTKLTYAATYPSVLDLECAAARVDISAIERLFGLAGTLGVFKFAKPLRESTTADSPSTFHDYKCIYIEAARY